MNQETIIMATRRQINVRLTELEIHAALKAIDRQGKQDRSTTLGKATARAEEKLHRAWGTLRRLSAPRTVLNGKAQV